MNSGEQTSGCERCGEISLASALFCPACGAPRARDFDGDALVGALVGERFLIKERLGHGASGTIYLAEHVTLRRRVALKVLHHELSRDDLAVERFRREATTVSEIDNEHIVQIHDFGRTSDGRLYLAMEFLEGETLDAVLRRDKRLPVDRTVDILIQLGEALMEAHAIGYIHRDLRPRNVFLSMRRGSANFVKLLDFGLAKLVEREGEAATTSLGMTFGDPKYMSPEQARGEGLDRRADVYSLGCIAYEMLLGEPPFTGGRVFDILTRHVDTQPTVPSQRRPDVPAWLDAAVLRMLAKHPDERYVTVYRLVEALRQGLATGETMSGETARRRATAPPPSISRAMAKFGLDDEINEAGAPMPVPVDQGAIQSAAVAPPETLEGLPLGAQADDSVDDLRATRVRQPGSGSVAAGPGPGAAGESQATASGKQRVASSDTSQTGISAAWFADGEARLGEGDEDELDDDLRAKLSRARARSQDAYDDDSLLYQQGPNLLKKFGLPAAGAVVLLIIVIAVWPRGESRSAASAPLDAGALAAITAPPDAGSAAEPDAQAIEPIDAGTPDARPRTTPSDRPPKPPTDSDPDPDPISTKPVNDQSVRQAEFYARLADQALRSGDTLGAASNFKKALELDAKNADAVTGMGEIALMQSLPTAAIAHLKKAAKLAPKSSRVHTLLGEAYLGDGRDEAAAASFKKALQLDPDNARARNGYNEAIGRIPPPGDDP